MIHYYVNLSKGFCKAYDNSIEVGAVYCPRATEEELLRMVETTVKSHKEKMERLIKVINIYIKEA